MSKTIDQRVVEMRFDNRNFESNVRESMSTLDKLKQKLNFKGASKGLENLNTSANKVNMNGLSSALEACHSRFSALEIMGVTALANITNSAVNAGKRIISALTIDPIKTGLQEYETQINAVQTILANTQKEGTNVKIVNKALDELNEYADQTIYNFTEMTRNIGTFTAAGVKLDTSVNAIKGIANLAAVSGSTSQQASTAMYQLSQALAAGKVQLMDWNSVVNAGMGGQVFQDALIRTSELMGTGAKAAIKMHGSFRESLTKSGWLTTEVLTETLNQIAGTYDKSELMAQGYTEAQADEIIKLAKTAKSAAQDVKTFTQMWDVLKESAQSGWSQTWRLIIGDFEEAKNLFTPLANFLTNIVQSFSDARNKLLESALGKSFTGLLDKIKTSADGVKNVVDTVENYGKVVDEIINGKWGNGQARWNKLTEAGYDWAHAQNLVNEKLGVSLRRTTQYKETQEEATKSQEKANQTTADYIVKLTKLSDAELKAKGYTDEQIKAFRDLAKAADKTGIPLKEFIENIDKIDGRYLLINSFKNLGMSLVSVFKSIGKAWRDAFPPMSSDTLFNIIAGFHKFSVVIRTKVEKNADKLTRTLKGLFAIIDMITMFIGGGFKIAFTVLKTILGAFNMDILDFTAKIGDAIVAVRDWIEENNILTIGITKAVSIIIKIAKAIGRFAKELWKLPGVQKVVTEITNAFSKLDDISLDDVTSMFKKLGNIIKKVFSNINKHFGGVPGDILSGLANGLKNGASSVIQGIINLAKTLIDKFKDILGIHSPSTVFFAIGGFIIAGLIGGLLSGSTKLGPAVSGITDKIKEFFTNTDWSTIFSKIFSTGMSIGLLLVAKNLSDTIKNFSSLASGLGDALSGIGDVTSAFAENMKRITKSVSYTIKSFGKVMRGIAFKKSTEGIKNLAISLLILVGAVAILTMLDIGEMWNAVAVIGVLAIILGTLTFALNKINNQSLEISKNGAKFTGVKTSLLTIGAALLMMGMVVKMMGKMNPDQMKQGFIGLAGAVIALGVLLAAYGLLIKGKGAQNMDKAGKMIRKMATTLLLMVLVVKLVSLLEWTEMGKGAAFIAVFTLFVTGLIAATKLAGKNIDKVGKMISKISWALLLMVAVVKLVSLLSPEEMKKGAEFAAAFLIFIGSLVAITKIGKEKQIAKIGGMVLAISAAMLIMVGVIKLIGTMEWDALKKGMVGVGFFGVLIIGLLLVVKSMGPEAPKLAGTLLAMSVAIGIMAAVALVLSLIDIDGLKKGITAVVLLGGILSLMIKATKDAQDVKGTLIAMSIAIGVMAASIAVLSFIDPTKLFGATVAIGLLMGMFALIESQAKHVIGSIGCLIVMTIAIGLMAAAIICIAKLAPDKALPSAIALSTLLLSMAVVLAILTMIGPLASAAYPAMLALAVFVAGLTVLLIALGALMKIPGLQEFLNTGLALMIQLAGGIGEMIGAFVKGAITQISSALPVIGKNLSLFMMNATPFIVGAKMVDGKVLAGVGILAAAILALTAVNLIEGIASFLSCGSSFSTLGTELSMFMMNALPFIMLSKQIDPSIMEGIKSLAEAILILTAADLIDGINLFGKSSLEKFGSQLGNLGTNINTFATNLGTFDEAKLNTVTCACKAIKALAQAASEIPNEGGLWAAIVGDNSLATFGSKLPGLATHINGFITNLGTFDESKVATVNCACKAISALAKAANEIPNEGGLWAAIVGDNSLATFGSKLPGLATHLNGFITNLGAFSEDNIATVKCACTAIKSLASAANSIPNEGGLWAKIVGDNSLATFGSKLPGLATHIKDFVKNLGTFTDAQVATVNSACKAIRTIAKLGEINIQDTGSGLNSFGKNMVKFAKKVKEFVEEIGEVGSKGIDSAIKKTKELVEMAKTVASTNVESLKTFGNSLKKVATDGVKGFVKEFSGESPKSKAKKATKALLDAAIKGAEDKKNDVKDKFKQVAKAAADGLGDSGAIDDAYTAGKNFVKGFANGIKDHKYLATNAGSSVGKAALKAAKEAVDENSPSKEMYKVGKFFDLGFVNGINKYSDKVYTSSYGVANQAKTGFTKAISKVADMINMDIDTQPTIRPVLDLSDIENGADTISGMFTDVGVMANLRAISSSMSTRNQNGANDDVVSAIDKLNKNLGNGGTQNVYNLNGITYNDDSNISSAVKALIRAIEIEGRV